MNRKQKIAIVVGAVVIGLLALFPPWAAQKIAVADEGEVTSFHMQFTSATAARTFDGFRWFSSTATRHDEDIVDTKPDYPAAISLQLAALALTVAAVVVLKEPQTGS